MKALGALDQVYRILGKACIGTRDCSLWEMLIVAAVVEHFLPRQGYVAHDICWAVENLLLVMSWAGLGGGLKAKSRDRKALSQ